MKPTVEKQRIAAKFLENRRFRFSTDLGCGEGYMGPIIKSHTAYLMGVDERLQNKRKLRRRGYDSFIQMNIKNWSPPEKCDSFFLFDIIEHLEKNEGEPLLCKIHGKFAMLTTPVKYFRNIGCGQLHLSLWRVEELEALGFSCWIFEQTSFFNQMIIGITETIQ